MLFVVDPRSSWNLMLRGALEHVYCFASCNLCLPSERGRAARGGRGGGTPKYCNMKDGREKKGEPWRECAQRV